MNKGLSFYCISNKLTAKVFSRGFICDCYYTLFEKNIVDCIIELLISIISSQVFLNFSTSIQAIYYLRGRTDQVKKVFRDKWSQSLK
jgi:hypothetical protein